MTQNIDLEMDDYDRVPVVEALDFAQMTAGLVAQEADEGPEDMRKG